MKLAAAIAAIALAGVAAAAAGWIVGGLAWAALVALKGPR